MLKEFRDFMMRGNVLDLAVAVIIGGAFGRIISSFVNDIIMPPIGLLLGHVDFTSLFVNLTGTAYASLKEAQAAGAPTINYGTFINTIIDFLIVALVIFLIVRMVNRMQRPKPQAAPNTKECPYCATTIALRATRCPNCTSELRPA
jgi:large conductance mechanosensitive channel